MRLSKDESTEANQQYWRFVEETAREFEKWPQWLQAGSKIVPVSTVSSKKKAKLERGKAAGAA